MEVPESLIDKKRNYEAGILYQNDCLLCTVLNEQVNKYNQKFLTPLKDLKFTIAAYKLLDKKLAKCVSKCGSEFWSPIKTLNFSFVENIKDTTIIEIIKNLFFSKFETLKISFEISTLGSLSFKNYAKYFLRIMPKATKQLVMYGITISRRHFEAIFHTINHLENLEFEVCKIDSYNLRLREDLDFKVKSLSFLSSGEVSNSNWLAHPDRFDAILKAFSKCSLKKSLRLVDIKWCYIHQDIARSMFFKHNLTDIEVCGLYDKNYKIYSFIL
ncbi:unnamed protein product [Moneuplotes crassus]|uniref:Uncharacterized protein n=1 Tax=Euplotes crassus TaxID=5936 RepID=A0AAD1XSW3_EUPCR|nr:unnamed protein product [Moneuplotes crassus]